MVQENRIVIVIILFIFFIVFSILTCNWWSCIHIMWSWYGRKKCQNFSILSNNNTVEKHQEVPLPNGVWNVDFGPPCWIADKKVVSVSLFARSKEKYIKNIEWISVKLIEFVVVVVLICFFVLFCFPLVIVHEKCGKHTQKKYKRHENFANEEKKIIINKKRYRYN